MFSTGGGGFSSSSSITITTSSSNELSAETEQAKKIKANTPSVANALIKNSAEDEVEINVDNITAVVFREVQMYVNSCGAGGSSSGGKKKKTAKRAKT